jgi:hypothetical protein
MNRLLVCDVLDIDGPEGLAAPRVPRSGGPTAPGSAGGHGRRWLAPLVHPHRARQPPTHGLAHVDWRGRGGCVLAPPSRHISGHSYRWLVGLDKAPLVEVPAALRLLLDPNPPTPARPARTPGPDLAGHPYGRAALAAELAALGRATPGHRNYTLNRTAFKVYRYVAGGVLDDQDVTLAFTTVARAIGLSAAETARTLASARTAGLANPRTIPTAPDASRQEIGP